MPYVVGKRLRWQVETANYSLGIRQRTRTHEVTSLAKPIEIGEHEFASTGAARAYIRTLRDAYADGERIGVQDDQFLRSLLFLHSEAADKIGVGVAHFTVATEKVYRRTRHFVVVRTDASETDFSFENCITGKNPRADRLGALREAVSSQTRAFKQAAFANADYVNCAVRDTPTAFVDAHVDHAPPSTFQKLVEEWLLQRGYDLDAIELTADADNQIVSQMANPLQRESWQAHHLEKAKLRIVCKQANLSDVRKSG